MPRAATFAFGALLLVMQAARAIAADRAPGTMSIPVSTARLAAAAGLIRADPTTLPLDIVRVTFATPEVVGDAPPIRLAAIKEALAGGGDSGARLPLPLSPRTWRAHVLHAEVSDDRLAAAILGTRAPALLYHGLLALDPPTLAWIETKPDVLATLLKHPGAAASFARSIHVRNGAVVTPGADASQVWQAIVDANPADAASFVTNLMTARFGRIAAFYDAVAHLDAVHQRFVIGAPGDNARVDRARQLADAVTRDMSPWRLEEYPFARPDLDASLLFRLVALDARGVPVGPNQRVWAQVFSGARDVDAAVDAKWLIDHVLTAAGAASRRRFEAFRFGQRVLASEGAANPRVTAAALRDFSRYPSLMLLLEGAGVRSAATYVAAGKAAAGLGADEDALAVFQSGLSIVDRARAAGTIEPVEVRRLIGSLVDAAGARAPRAPLLTWFTADLLPSLQSRTASGAEPPVDADDVVLRAISGPAPAQPPAIEWEGQRYHVDLSQPEWRRLKALRRMQAELPLGDALPSATPRNLSGLANSLAALVYAVALGQPDSQAAGGGAVWRRHRFGSGSAAPGESQVQWRGATEVFGKGEWHLTGSLLRLDVVMAQLALRRLDPTDMPARSLLSTMDRRTLARSVALIESRTLSDEARDGIALALMRGRARAAAVVANPAELDTIAGDAGLSEWRISAIRWLIAHDAARVPAAFTTLELFRLGGGDAGPGWGAASDTLDGCVCLRMPDRTPWEEYAGRASSGQLGTQLADVMLRTAEALAARKLPAVLIGAMSAFAMQDIMDSGQPQYFDDWLSVAFAARDLSTDRFDDYVAALTAAGPLVPVPRNLPK